MRKLNYKVVNGQIVVSTEEKQVLFVINKQDGKSEIDTIEEHMRKKDMYLPMYDLVQC